MSRCERRLIGPGISVLGVFLGLPRAAVGSGARQGRSVEPMTVTTSPVDETKLHDFLGQMVGDLGAAANAPLMLIGDKLGLYKALASSGPLSSAALAAQTGSSGSGWRHRRPLATSAMTLLPRPTRWDRNRRWCLPMRTAPSSSPDS